MKICLVHNAYARPSGEETMLHNIASLLRDHRHSVLEYLRFSANIAGTPFGRTRAFFSGIYSASAASEFASVLRDFRPDIVQVQNVYPLISPVVLELARQHNVPVVLRCSNYRLICPSGLLLSHGGVCEKCVPNREYWCILRNCERNVFKSVGYALRNYAARLRNAFANNVSLYIAQTAFQQHKLVSAGFDPDKFVVIPNMTSVHPDPTPWSLGSYVAFSGRLAEEKGIRTLTSAARMCSDIPFQAAGAIASPADLASLCSPNFYTQGHLGSPQLDDFYKAMRVLVLPSIWYEGFPSVILEAMLHAKPVICSNVGGIPEIVQDGVTGLLFEPANPLDLSRKIRLLWDRPDLCRQMGQAALQKVLREYSPSRYYDRLMAAYQKALSTQPASQLPAAAAPPIPDR